MIERAAEHLAELAVVGAVGQKRQNVAPAYPGGKRWSAARDCIENMGPPLIDREARSVAVVGATLVEELRGDVLAAEDDKRLAEHVEVHDVAVLLRPLEERLVRVLGRHDSEVAEKKICRRAWREREGIALPLG